VEFELLFELKFEQKKGTSLVKPVLSRRKSGLQTERLSVPVIYFDITPWFERDLASIGSIRLAGRQKYDGIPDQNCHFTA
jgi:hypothetical protein